MRRSTRPNLCQVRQSLTIPFVHRLNRYSMPVTRSRTYLADLNLEDSNNTTGFLFGDEDSNGGENRTTPTNNNPDSFPALLRQQGYPGLVSRFPRCASRYCCQHCCIRQPLPLPLLVQYQARLNVGHNNVPKALWYCGYPTICRPKLLWRRSGQARSWVLDPVSWSPG